METKTALLTLLLANTIEFIFCTDPLVIQTKKGSVRGITEITPTGKTVDSWYSIPYAQPPVNDLRFRHPRPMDKWRGVVDATQRPNSCIQITDTFFGDFEGSNIWNANTNMSEDCLYISVIVPKPRIQKAAVLVWIYGGGFYSGTSTLDVYDYKTLAAEQNIILVAPQYRVASLGFLHMGTADVPGNTGLYDQLMALQWIQENIEYFGGNRENVTLFGESAGAASVSMLLLSNLSRNLFSQAIMQSGSATVPWGFMTKELSIHRGLLLAQAFDCPQNRENMTAVIECLRKVNATALVFNEASSGLCDFPFVPIVDGAFFDQYPLVNLREGNFKKTNILLGSNTEEGYFFIMYFLKEEFSRKENVQLSKAKFNYSVEKVFPNFSDLAREAIKYEYTPWLNPNDGNLNRNAIDKMVGDYHFTCNVNEFAYHYAKKGNNVYMYYFTHRSSTHKWPKWTGVLHGDEIHYIFGEPLRQKSNYTKKEKELSRRMMKYWANFAKTGNPNQGADGKWTSIYWPPHTDGGKEYVILDTNTTQTARGPRLKQCAFWKKFLPKLHKYTADESQKGPEQCPMGSKSLGMIPSDFLMTGMLLLAQTLVGLSVFLLGHRSL